MSVSATIAAFRPARRTALKLLGAVLAVTVLMLPTATLRDMMPGQAIIDGNATYLRDARATALTDMLHLAEIDAVVAVVQTAEVGLSLGLSAKIEIGQALDPLSDGLKVGVAAALLGAGFYQGAIVASDLVSQLEVYLLKAVALAAIGFLISGELMGRIHPSIHMSANGLLRVSVAVFLAARLLVPYSIATTALISDGASAVLLSESREQIHFLHGFLIGDRSRAIDLNGLSADKAALRTLERAASDFPHNLEIVATYSLRHITVSLFQGILMPLAILAALLAVFRRAVRHFMAAGEPSR